MAMVQQLLVLVMVAHAAAVRVVKKMDDDKSMSCPAGQVPFTHYVWVGKAPFCAAKPTDCPSGYQYVRSNKRGDGKLCTTGNKVECKKSSCSVSDAANPECKPGDFKLSILGVAPFCAKQACDCILMHQLPFHVTRNYTNPCIDRANWIRAGGHDTAPCITGTHVVCLKDISGILNGNGRSDDLKQIIAAERERCERKEEMRHERFMAVVDLIGQIVTVAAAR